MAVLFPRHTLTFSPMTEPVQGDGSVNVPEEGDGEEVVGHLSPMNSQTAYEKFGVELNRPHRFRYEIADESRVKVGYKATFDSRTFEVSAPPRKHELGSEFVPVDTMQCVLEEREFA